MKDNKVPTMLSNFNFIIKLPTMLDSLPKQHATLTVVEQLSSAKMMDKRDPHYLFWQNERTKRVFYCEVTIHCVTCIKKFKTCNLGCHEVRALTVKGSKNPSPFVSYTWAVSSVYAPLLSVPSSNVCPRLRYIGYAITLHYKNCQ